MPNLAEQILLAFQPQSCPAHGVLQWPGNAWACLHFVGNFSGCRKCCKTMTVFAALMATLTDLLPDIMAAAEVPPTPEAQAKAGGLVACLTPCATRGSKLACLSIKTCLPCFCKVLSALLQRCLPSCIPSRLLSKSIAWPSFAFLMLLLLTMHHDASSCCVLFLCACTVAACHPD